MVEGLARARRWCCGLFVPPRSECSGARGVPHHSILSAPDCDLSDRSKQPKRFVRQPTDRPTGTASSTPLENRFDIPPCADPRPRPPQTRLSTPTTTGRRRRLQEQRSNSSPAAAPSPPPLSPQWLLVLPPDPPSATTDHLQPTTDHRPPLVCRPPKHRRETPRRR